MATVTAKMNPGPWARKRGIPMTWTALKLSDNKQETISSIEVRFSGTKHFALQMVANNSDLRQPEMAAGVEKAPRERFRELLGADEWVCKALVDIEDLEKRRQPHAQAVMDAQAKLADIAAARKDRKLLEEKDMGKKLASLEKEELAL